MARPIAPTPVLDAKASQSFEERVKRDLDRPARAVPTPRISETAKLIMKDAQERQK